MNFFINVVTRYLLVKDIIDEEEQDLYRFGFETLIRRSIYFLLAFYIAYKMNMLFEAIFFFVIFRPLRTYAGGLHLEKYSSCLIFSSLSYFSILLTVKYIDFNMKISCVFSLFLILAIYILYPVENINRKVDVEENVFFKKKLNLYLIIDIFTIMILFFLRQDKFLFLIFLTLVLVVITMILGKIKYRRDIQYLSI